MRADHTVAADATAITVVAAVVTVVAVAAVATPSAHALVFDVFATAAAVAVAI
jgi:hypothetical protein